MLDGKTIVRHAFALVLHDKTAWQVPPIRNGPQTGLSNGHDQNGWNGNRGGPVAPPKKSPIVKRSVNLDGHKTSVSLENAFWDALKQIAAGENIALHELIFKINNERKLGGLSSALRLFVLEYYRQKAAAAKLISDQISARPDHKITR